MNKLVLLVVVILIEIFSVYLLSVKVLNNYAIIQAEQSLLNFTTDNLSLYNGINPDLPIYLAFNGYVYDVTPGKNYYEVGGSYHYLAGKDSTADLNLFGGDIIVRKYKVIGRLID